MALLASPKSPWGRIKRSIVQIGVGYTLSLPVLLYKHDAPTCLITAGAILVATVLQNVAEGAGWINQSEERS